MPKNFKSDLYWVRKQDYEIPKSYTGDRNNYIFTIYGMKQIAQYYREKYEIEIYPFSSKVEDAALEVKSRVAELKKLSTEKCGFILWDKNHAMPMIYEKGNLFLLDSGYLASSNIKCSTFRKKLLELMPELKIWTQTIPRQIDETSCVTDAMVILKDGLRLSLIDIAQKKLRKEDKDGLNKFDMPEELYKTAQIGSALEKSGADLKKEILTGKHNKKISLGEFRKKHDVSSNQYKTVYKNEERIDVLVKQRNFGSFTLHKGREYSKLIEKRWQEEQKLILEIENVRNKLQILLPALDEDNPLIKASTDLTHYLQCLIDESSIVDHKKIKEDLKFTSSLLESVALKVTSPSRSKRKGHLFEHDERTVGKDDVVAHISKKKTT